jgi:hypothetical protein
MTFEPSLLRQIDDSVVEQNSILDSTHGTGLAVKYQIKTLSSVVRVTNLSIPLVKVIESTEYSWKLVNQSVVRNIPNDNRAVPTGTAQHTLISLRKLQRQNSTLVTSESGYMSVTIICVPDIDGKSFSNAC